MKIIASLFLLTASIASAATIVVGVDGTTLKGPTAANLRTAAGIVIGTDIQAFDSDLTSWAAITRAANFDTFTATPSSENLAALVTGESGTGALLFGSSPTISAATLNGSNIFTGAGTNLVQNNWTFDVGSQLNLNGTTAVGDSGLGFSAPGATATRAALFGATTAITGGGTLALGGFTLTVPSTGTAVTTTTINNATLPGGFTTLAASGTFTCRDVLFAADNTYSIGASGASRPAHIYAFQSITAPTLIVTTSMRVAAINDPNNSINIFTLTGSSPHVTFSNGQTSPIFRFAGASSSQPALKRNGTTLAVRLADDSADAPLSASNITASGTLAVTGASTFTGNVTTAGKVSNTKVSTTLAAAATTLAVTNNFVAVTGDAGTNILATITGGVSGQSVTLVTITDDGSATANTVNLSAAFASTANDTVTLIFDGTSWFEVSRSLN